ncbi:hypothetical protein E2C01_031918 [Portunus trituberculatus]|uniref:Uncharacterized protein n=1 Tax=Portunus trituberculatus TaxID=210409 RepID=A0A5B7EW22_PORTR|nr:hypothetical protein [Portunus trituberculatus]
MKRMSEMEGETPLKRPRPAGDTELRLLIQSKVRARLAWLAGWARPMNASYGASRGTRRYSNLKRRVLIPACNLDLPMPIVVAQNAIKMIHVERVIAGETWYA